MRPAVVATGLVKEFEKGRRTLWQRLRREPDRRTRFRAVDGIDLRVETGEIFGLLGPNGAGKTTTMKMLSTLLEPTSGTIEVLGIDVARRPREVRARLGAMLSGERSLYWKLTARENLDFYAGILGMRLVKRSVNQDDPGTYHLFYADAEGHPGSDLTFFPWAHMAPPRIGHGLAVEVALEVPAGSLDYWAARLDRYSTPLGAIEQRFGDNVLPLVDPHGLKLSLVEPARVPARAFTPWDDGPVRQSERRDRHVAAAERLADEDDPVVLHHETATAQESVGAVVVRDDVAALKERLHVIGLLASPDRRPPRRREAQNISDRPPQEARRRSPIRRP